jgi:hypothetical protein
MDIENNPFTVGQQQGVAPMPLTPEQNKTIRDNGDQYRDEVFSDSWKTRSQGFWAGNLLGAFFGAAIGGLAILSTVLVGVPLATIGAMALPIVGGFTLAGAAMGATILTATALTVGAVVGGQKIDDRKRAMENSLGVSKYNSPPEHESAWNNIIPFTKGSPKIFNARNALIFGALGLIAAPLILSVASPLGGLAIFAGAKAIMAPALFTKAVACMTYTTCGLFGAWFGVDMPTITGNALKFVGDVFSGRLFENGKAQEIQITQNIPSSSLSTQVQPSLAFDGSTVNTMIAPGGYAGKQTEYLRKRAEQQFEKMQPPGTSFH